MDGEQTQIALDSPLDINSQNMLVPISQPKFAYNRQKYLGSLLQTSVRYESDGWFAGWWDHDFVVNSQGNNETRPPLPGGDFKVIERRVDPSGNTYYIVQYIVTPLLPPLTPIVINITIATSRIVNVLAGNVVIGPPYPDGVVRLDDNRIQIVGNLNDAANTQVTCIIDLYTGSLLSFTGPANFVYTAKKIGYYSELIVEMQRNEGDFIRLHKGANLQLNGVAFPYTRDATNSRWGTEFLFNDTTKDLVVPPPPYTSTYEVLGTTVITDDGDPTETVSREVHELTQYDATSTIYFEQVATADRFNAIVANTKIPGGRYDESKVEETGAIAPSNGVLDITHNRATTTLLDNNNGAVGYFNNSYFRAEYSLPIWLLHQMIFTYNYEWEPTAINPISNVDDGSYVLNIGPGTLGTNMIHNRIADTFANWEMGVIITRTRFIYTPTPPSPRPPVRTRFMGTAWQDSGRDIPGLPYPDKGPGYGYTGPQTVKLLNYEDSVRFKEQNFVYNYKIGNGAWQDYDTSADDPDNWPDIIVPLGSTLYTSIDCLKPPIGTPPLIPAQAGEPGQPYFDMYQGWGYEVGHEIASNAITTQPRVMAEGSLDGFMITDCNAIPGSWAPIDNWAPGTRINPDTQYSRDWFEIPAQSGSVQFPVTVNGRVYGIVVNRPYVVVAFDDSTGVRIYGPTTFFEFHSAFDNVTVLQWPYLGVNSPMISYVDSDGIETTAQPPAPVFKPIASTISIPVMWGQYVGLNPPPPEWAPRDTCNDAWRIYLRCFNDGDMRFPVPPGSNYFTVSFGSFSDFTVTNTGNESAMISLRTISQDSYIPWHTPLFVPPIVNDNALIVYDRWRVTVTVPQLVRAYSTFIVRTVDVVLWSDASFTATIDPAPTPPLPPPAVPPNRWELALLDPALSWVVSKFNQAGATTQDPPTPMQLTVSLDSSALICYAFTEQPGGNGVYPEFVNSTSHGMIDYIPAFTENTFVVMEVAGRFNNYIIDIDSTFVKTINNIMTQNTFSDTVIVDSISEVKHQLTAPVDYYQDIVLSIRDNSMAPNYNTDSITLRYYIIARTFTRDMPVVANDIYTTTITTPMPPDTVFTGRTIQYIGSINATNSITVTRSFIYEKSGLMNTPQVLIASESLGQLTLQNGYGTIDLNQYKLYDSTLVLFNRGEQEQTAAVPPVLLPMAKIWVYRLGQLIVQVVPEGFVQKDNSDIKWLAHWNDRTPGYYEEDFTYTDGNHTLLIDKNSKEVLTYNTKDIRTGNLLPVYKRDVSDVFMFLKQKWSNDVSVECFWYVDENHILELSKYYMTLYVKVPNSLHDWDADNWEIQYRSDRSNWITTFDSYYALSSAKEDMPVFFKLQAKASSIDIYYIPNITTLTAAQFSDPDGLLPNTSVWIKVSVPVRRVDFGANNFGSLPLATGNIIALLDLNVSAMLNSSKITATCTQRQFVIGIHYSSGLLQWALKIDVSIASTTASVVNGYGFVGVDGTLTGGEIPTQCCGANGFNTNVYNITSLPVTGQIPNQCFGTQSTVWFIYTSISSIVSHLTLLSRVYSPVTLTLNNNIASDYQTMSFATTKLVNRSERSMSMNDMDSEWAALKSDQFPTIYTTGSVNYLNTGIIAIQLAAHSLGSYAYVYRNSTQYQKEGVTDNDITFCTVEKSVSFTTNISNIKSPTITAKIIGGIVQTPPPAAASVNSAQNQAAMDDAKGRKYSQFFEDNLAGTVLKAVNTSGPVISTASTLLLKQSLSMFYSVSDGTKCYAGPGFVNHNFVGQCVAQSVSDVQLNSHKWGYKSLNAMYIIARLTAGLMLKRTAFDVLKSTVDSLAPGNAGAFAVGTGTTIPIGMAAAVAPVLAMAAVTELIRQSETALAAVNAIVEQNGGIKGAGYDGGSCNHNDTAIEGTHSYGDKPMSFFYPAFGVIANTYTDESVTTAIKKKDVYLDIGSTESEDLYKQDLSSLPDNQQYAATAMGRVYFVDIAIKGANRIVSAPSNTAVVEGTTSFLPTDAFKNEQIGVSTPQFAPPALFDYMIDSQWQLGFTAILGEVVSVMVDDTKVIDGEPSNIVISPTFLGIGSAYTAIECIQRYDKNYLRPVAITQDTIALNMNRVNCVHDAKAYHAFDGIGNRIIKWSGVAGMDKNRLWQQYSFQINDHFKRSNIWPPSQFMGSFTGPPVIATATIAYDKVANLVQVAQDAEGIANDIPGELKDARRFSIPVHSENLSTIPAVIRTIGPYKLHVMDGVTSLTTDGRNTQGKYKAPSSIDFNIDGDVYRATEEYICSVKTEMGLIAVENLVAKPGIEFIGATTKEAFFYSQATRLYYSFTGGRQLTKQDIINRFKDIQTGRWDFVNQEVVFKCLRGEENEVIIARLDKRVEGELYPPNKTIYNDRSGFKLFSTAGGTVFQGPKRFIVSRFITLEHMYDEINANKKRWTRESREDWLGRRDYGWEYDKFDGVGTPTNAVDGWTHNPFLLVTAMLGTGESTDNKYEWELTWAWTEQMDHIYAKNEYVTVNVMAEVVTEGGTVLQRPTHIFLYKELFTRQGAAGYYTHRFQSNAGAGNRERLYLWSDGFVALEDMSITAQMITSKRTQPVTIQADVQDLVEL